MYSFVVINHVLVVYTRILYCVCHGCTTSKQNYLGQVDVPRGLALVTLQYLENSAIARIKSIVCHFYVTKIHTKPCRIITFHDSGN